MTTDEDRVLRGVYFITVHENPCHEIQRYSKFVSPCLFRSVINRKQSRRQLHQLAPKFYFIAGLFSFISFYRMCASTLIQWIDVMFIEGLH